MNNDTPASPTNSQDNIQPLPPKAQRSKSRDLLLVAMTAVVTTLLVGGYFGYSQYREANARRATNWEIKQVDEESGTDAADVDEAELAAEPEETKPTEKEKPASTPPKTSKPTTNTTTPKPKVETRDTTFVKGGAGLSDGVVYASNSLSAAETGTCYYAFSLNGKVRVEKSVHITNSKVCAVEIPQSEFPKSGDYSMYLKFTSDDGAVKTSVSYNVEVN